MKKFKTDKFLTTVFVVILYMDFGWAQKSPYDWALIKLDYIKQEKINHLQRFSNKLHAIAQKASKDKRIIAFFEMNRQYFNAAKTKNPLNSLTNDVEKMRWDFDHYYLANYYVFYDILSVNMEGVAFYTVRRNLDSYINLADEKNTIGPLGESIAQKPKQEIFIDFYHYSPSSEPPALFVEPVIYQGKQEGWIVLQCAINKINSIFASTDDSELQTATQ